MKLIIYIGWGKKKSQKSFSLFLAVTVGFVTFQRVGLQPEADFSFCFILCT